MLRLKIFANKVIEYEKNKQKLDIDFVNNYKQLGVYPKFLIFKLLIVSDKDDSSILKDTFITLSISIIKNFNMF